MSIKYYVIVDLYSLRYMSNGECETSIAIADKFDTFEEALEELKTYDDTKNFEVYEVIEHITRQLRKMDKNRN